MKNIFWVVILLAAGCSSNYPDRATAPSGTPEERDKWGIETFGDLYSKSVHWVKANTFIQKKSGGILSVAPIGETRCGCAFTDGCSCGLSLEVKGANGTALLQMNGVFVDTLSRQLYLGGALWKKDGIETKLHRSGMTYEEYYNPEHWISVLNDEIAANYPYHTSYYFRAQVNYHLRNHQKAIDDIQAAIKKLNDESKRPRISDGSGRLKPGWTRYDADQLRECYKVLAVIQAFNEEQKIYVSDTVRQIQNAPFFEEANPTKEDYLYFWVIQQHAGFKNQANKQLAAFYSTHPKKTSNTFTQFAPFYLGDKSQESVKVYGTYDGFYFAQKLYLDGNLKIATDYLKEYLEKSPIDRPDHRAFLARILLNSTTSK